MAPGVDVAWLAELAETSIPTAVFDLDGTFVAINRAGEALVDRPRAQVVGRRAWDLAPGAEHIWSEALAVLRGGGDYRGDIVIATPQEPRRIGYLATLGEHAGGSYVILVAAAIGDEQASGDDVVATRGLEHAIAALRAKLR
jgi:PAS domain-containing protein